MIAVDPNDPQGDRVDRVLSEVGQHLGPGFPASSSAHGGRQAARGARHRRAAAGPAAARRAASIFSSVSRQAGHRGRSAGDCRGASRRSSRRSWRRRTASSSPRPTPSSAGSSMLSADQPRRFGRRRLCRPQPARYRDLARLPPRRPARQRHPLDGHRRSTRSVGIGEGRSRNLGLVDGECQELDHRSAAGDPCRAL